MGILWARLGCAVLIIDQIGHGERLETYPWNREGYRARYMTGMQLYVAGESLIKWMVWDVMRGIDLLVERPDIDRGKIVLLGAVAAGGDPAAVTAALDPRVAAVVPFTFGESMPELGPGGSEFPGLPDPGWGSWETTRNLPNSISGGFLPWIVCASVAPRRFVYSYELGWDVEKVPAWPRYRKVFGFYNALDRLDEAHGFGPFPGPGECANIGPSQRKTLYPELQRWFGIPIPESEPEDRRPEEELASLSAGTAAQLGMKTIHELAREQAAPKMERARAALSALDAQGRRKWLREKWAARLGDIAPDPNAHAVSRWTRRDGAAEAEGFTLETEPGIVVPVVLLRPAGAKAGLPVITVVSQFGRERLLSNRRGEIDAILASGAAVCLPDLRGIGETSPDTRGGPLSAGIELAATELMMGNTLVGARLKDLRSVLAWLGSRPEIDRKRIALWGDSDVPPNPQRMLMDEAAGWRLSPEIDRQAEPLGGLLALFGALYEDSVAAVAVRRGLSGYATLFDDAFTYVPSDIIVPDSAAAGDLADIAAALAPRPLYLEQLVDARNRAVPQSGLGAWTGPAATVRTAGEGAGAWLAAWVKKAR
jgi:cephalosporin-C deacetylase-like acetyl esterase